MSVRRLEVVVVENCDSVARVSDRALTSGDVRGTRLALAVFACNFVFVVDDVFVMTSC